jgi:GAF domain-containing protein
VYDFPGHIACDAASRSELVVPILDGETLVGVLDLDSPLPGRFGQADVDGCVKLVQRLSARFGAMVNAAASS